MQGRSWLNPQSILTGLGLLLLGAAYWLGLTSRVDVMNDDGHYLALGHAIANGDGYRIIWQVVEASETTIPPAYSALLAILWRFFPHFPTNIFAFKALNIPFALGSVLLTYITARRVFNFQRWQALLSSSLVAFSQLHIAFMDMTTIEVTLASTLLLSSLGLHQLLTRPERHPALTPWLIAALAVGPCYLKKAGFPLLVATVLWLWFAGRRALACTSAFAMGILLLPWYSYRALEAKAVDISTVTMIAGRPKDTLAVTERIWNNFWEVVSSAIPLGVTPLFPPSTQYTGALGVLLTLTVLLGLVQITRRNNSLYAWLFSIYLFIIIFLNTWETVRFTLVLTPIITMAWIAATTKPLTSLFVTNAPTHRRVLLGTAIVLSLVPVCFSLLAAKRFVAIFFHPPYHDSLLPRKEKELMGDLDALLNWEKKQAQANAFWIDTYPKGLYLHTQRKCASMADLENFVTEPTGTQSNRTYWLVVRSGYWGETPVRDLVESKPERVSLLFQSPHEHFRVYQWRTP